MISRLRGNYGEALQQSVRHWKRAENSDRLRAAEHMADPISGHGQNALELPVSALDRLACAFGQTIEHCCDVLRLTDHDVRDQVDQPEELFGRCPIIA